MITRIDDSKDLFANTLVNIDASNWPEAAIAEDIQKRTNRVLLDVIGKALPLRLVNGRENLRVAIAGSDH